ncbi:SIR2-domain-containing protein [Trichodelitschia bisporula]|uniref:SIR2-domain-containing protein n=1 Tax=Trichodelitschia bisporula TaxID=703511 RepID=A0A6G1HYW3_9PEZI|nr:SIR2-domain-containing protein [Trichodelitschia bisporula]
MKSEKSISGESNSQTVGDPLPDSSGVMIPSGRKSEGVSSNHDDEEFSSSFYEEVLDDDRPVSPSDQAREALELRKRLHEVGLQAFVGETLGESTVPLKTLLAAFRVRKPEWMDENCSSTLRLLGLAMLRELTKRQRLPQFSTIDHAVQLLKDSRHIVVVTGAGISTSLGIPDFRSKDTGFYSQLRALGYDEPEQVFDIDTFTQDPTVFYELAGEILPALEVYSPTHQFIRLLQDKNKLQRNYTQNIDNVEKNAGIRADKLVQCHGSWATAHCLKCGFLCRGKEIYPEIKQKKVARCKKCKVELEEAASAKRKRSSTGKSRKRQGLNRDSDDSSDGEYDIPEAGVMKPGITFFGEALPQRFHDCINHVDKDIVDLVIVIGTSMKVRPVSEIPVLVPNHVPHINISRDPINHIDFDITLLGDCDVVVAELCRRAGWELNHDSIPKNQRVEVKPVETMEATFTVKQTIP